MQDRSVVEIRLLYLFTLNIIVSLELLLKARVILIVTRINNNNIKITRK